MVSSQNLLKLNNPILFIQYLGYDDDVRGWFQDEADFPHAFKAYKWRKGAGSPGIRRQVVPSITCRIRFLFSDVVHNVFCIPREIPFSHEVIWYSPRIFLLG